MTRRRRQLPPPPKGPLAAWTVPRATVAGLVLGLAALLTAAFANNWPDTLLYPYILLLALTFACGVSILWITLQDVRTRGRGGRMRPIRAFDVAMGALLVLPSAYGLWLVRGPLGL